MGLVFTRAWEDDRLDAAVLSVGPGERALVVAAAGDAALALAAGGAQIVAVDLNPDQVRLAALKIAAAARLDPQTAHRWFEIGRDPDAAAVYRERVRSALAPADAAFWDDRIGIIGSGLHEHAGVGRPFARLGRGVRLLRPGLAPMIERVTDPAEQAAWWRQHVRPVFFGSAFHWLAAHTRILSPLAPDPHELARMRRGGWSDGLVRRIDDVVAATLVRRHPWWRPVFSGRPADPGDGAAWLDAEHFAALSDAGARIDLVVGDLTAVLSAQPPASLAAISVSNVPDWLDPAGVAELAQAAATALAPGGRVLVRRVVRPEGPDPFAALLVHDPVSPVLIARERTALYEAVDLYRRPDQPPQ